VFPTLWPVKRRAAKRSRGRKATEDELLTISKGCHGPAILLTDQRDGSESVDGWTVCGATMGIPAHKGLVERRRLGAQSGNVR